MDRQYGKDRERLGAAPPGRAKAEKKPGKKADAPSPH
jgi:hypothetical protein